MSFAEDSGGQPAARVTFSYSILLLDIALRWVSWVACRPMPQHEIRLWLLQLLGVPFVVIVSATWWEEHVRRKAALKGFAESVPEASAMRLSLCLFAVILASTMAWRHLAAVPGWLRVTLVVLGTVAYIAYLGVLWPFSIRIDDSPEPLIPTKRTPGLPVDENDRCIIELDALKESLKQRVDTYTLESALFGALAFSAFVTIVASNQTDVQGIRAFSTGLVDTMHHLLNLELSKVWERLAFADSASKMRLFAVIAFETLVCSLMFLAVIICRLRFTDLLNRAERSIRMASSYNAKEDEIHMMQLEHPQLEAELGGRLAQLTGEIDELIGVAGRQLRQSKPVLTYMSGFRRAGVVGFLIVLVTSALWVAPEWAVGFAVFGAIAFAYPVLDRLLRDSKLHGSDIVSRVSKRLRPNFLG